MLLPAYHRFLLSTLACVAVAATAQAAHAQTSSPPVNKLSGHAYDLVLRNGRVIDPETKLDAVRNVGIENGRIAAVSADELTGKTVIDATGLVIAPGFIDLHSHGQDEENY